MSDTSTKSLLHFNGANNSTGIYDFGSTKNWLVGGTAKLVISTKKFGRSCLYLDGESGYVYTVDHADFTLGLANFSFDFWIKLPLLPGSTPQCIFSKYQDSNNRYYLELYDNAGVQTMRFRSREGATLLNDASFPVSTLNVDTWYHFELTRSGTTLYLFQSGTLLSTVSGALEISDLTGNFEIGRNGTAGYLNAYVDEFRYTYGTARHTASFTNETYAYKRVGVDDEFTAALLHFNGSEGSTTITDQTGMPWTVYSHPYITQTNKKLGNASGYATGGEGFISNGATALYKLWIRDCWTIDFWIYKPSLPTGGNQHALMYQGDVGEGWYFYNSGAAYYIRVNQNGAVDIPLDHFTVSTWHHIAIIKNSSYITVYCDGVPGTATDISSFVSAYSATMPAYHMIGTIPGGTGTDQLIDEYRFSPDIKRWTADFSDAVPSDEYGTIYKSADVTFAALADAAFDTLWDDVDPHAHADATFFGQAMYLRAEDEDAHAVDLFEGQYWYEKVISEGAVSGASFTAGYYQTWPLPAEADAVFDSNYVVFIDVPALKIPIPTLEGQCGYNAVLDSSHKLCSLSAETGALLDKSIPLITISATGDRSIASDMVGRTPFPYLNAGSDPAIIVTLLQNIPFVSLEGDSYITGTNTLNEDFPFISIYANAVNSRSFSTYVLEYTR
jgi:hypothetical protein